ncbi:IS110 family transposase [Fredinandcohnia humi]
MRVMVEYACGLDIHKDSIVGCVLTPTTKEIRTFGTMTHDLLNLLDWIKGHHCTDVAMESAGVYWKPVYNVLECVNLNLLVVNAQHIKAVPGRKTDVKDAEWIADLLRHGLLKSSFIPSRDQRELRELVRYRRSLIEERTREVNRLQKVLEGANIKLGSVASSVVGVSSRMMIEAMISGETDPAKLAQLALGRLKEKKDQLEYALTGIIGHHQQLMWELQLKHLDFLDEQIERLDEEVAKRLSPSEEDIKRIMTIPGIGRRSAEHLIAEIGTNMDRFPSAEHIASWAGMTPGHNESAGKKKSAKTRKGNKYLRSTLIEVGHAIGRKKKEPNFLTSKYHRIASRRGKNRAAVAVGHAILKIIYHLLKKKETYQDLGADYFDKRREETLVRRAIKKLKTLGYDVDLKPSA